MAIDLSRIPLPSVIEALSYEQLLSAFRLRFVEIWSGLRAVDPTLPSYDVDMLETDPVVIAGQAWAYLRLLDRQRVNDVVAALLAPTARGSNLDNVVARQGLHRKVLVEATSRTPAVMEEDAALLRRYFLSFERPSAGSANRYLFEAWEAWPTMLDARVNGFAVHGRRGDVDVVIIGPEGVAPTAEQRAAVRTAVHNPSVLTEAVAVTVLNAIRREYAIDLVVEVLPGPDPELVRQEVISRIRSAAQVRMLLDGEIPAGYLVGAAYGASIVRVRDLAPVAIEPDPYTVPVMTGLEVVVEVRT